jgi:SHS2 domain-containing protein
MTRQLTQKNYEYFDHTADIGIRAYGKTLNEAFENAALAMFDTITVIENITEVGEYKIQLASNDLEQLLVDWLSELLYVHETERVLLCRFKVDVDHEKYKLVANAYGEKLDLSKHTYKTEVKAVTYHKLEVTRRNERWCVQVVLDI